MNYSMILLCTMIGMMQHMQAMVSAKPMSDAEREAAHSLDYQKTRLTFWSNSLLKDDAGLKQMQEETDAQKLQKSLDEKVGNKVSSTDKALEKHYLKSQGFSPSSEDPTINSHDTVE